MQNNFPSGTKFLIVIAGPTAVGKTRIAIELAKIYDAEVFSADSRQFYREMNIGTAKPGPQELDEVKHHFIDNLSIHNDYDAGAFESEIIKALDVYFEDHDIAILAGGTGLYIKAVLYGLDNFPIIPKGIVASVQQDLENNGIGFLQKELQKCDPEYYAESDIQNPHRLIRAISIFRATGKTFSSYRTSSKKERYFVPVLIALKIPRRDLYDRINLRVDQMIKEGWLDEARQLLPWKHLNALNTVGYKELFSYLEGEMTMEVAIEKIKINTRRYAKRQMTWFSNQDDFFLISPDNLEELKTYIDKTIADYIKGESQ